MFKKLKVDVALALEILKILPEFWADYKATKIVGQKDWTDVKTTLAKIEALTGHTATVTALAAQASVPTSVPVVLPPAPTAAQGLAKDLSAAVAKVDPMAGVKLP